MEKRYYIAYGNNLNIRQMRYRCPEVRIIGTAVIKDYELLFKGSKTGAVHTLPSSKRKEAWFLLRYGRFRNRMRRRWIVMRDFQFSIIKKK